MFNFVYILRRKLLYLILALAVFFSMSTSYSEDQRVKKMQLVFAMDVIRHGDRTPLYTIPSLSTSWPDAKKGHLTALGVQNSENFGRNIKNYYINKQKLLSSKFNKNHVLIRTTNYQRTIATAKAVLKGMYPKQSKNIPIMVVKNEEDKLLRTVYPRVAELKQKYILYKTSEVTRKEIQDLLGQINSILGGKLETTQDFLHVASVLMANRVHHIRLPKGFTKSLVDRIITIRNQLVLNRYTVPAIYCTVASNLLLDIVENIKDAQNNRVNHSKSSLKYILYVSHDTILMSLLNLMNYELKKVPPFGANVRFELFEDVVTKEFFVRASYKGKNIELCSSEYCSFSEFSSLMLDKIKQQCE